MHEICNREETDQVTILHNRKPADAAGDQDAGGLPDIGIRLDGNGFGGHQEPELDLFRFSQQILSRDDTNDLIVLDYWDTGDSCSLEYF